MAETSRQVRVVLSGGIEVCILTLTEPRTVLELKTDIEGQDGTPLAQQRLLLDGAVLADNYQVIPEGGNICITLVRVQRTLLAAGSDDDKVRIIDAATGDVLKEISEKDVWSIAFGPGGEHVAVGCKKICRILSWETGEVVSWPQWSHKGPPKADIHGKKFNSVSFSRCGGKVATATHDGMARVIDTRTGEVLQAVKHHPSLSRVFCASFNADASLLATGMEDSKVRIIDVTSGEILRDFALEVGQCFATAFSPDGARLATAWSDRKVRILDAGTMAVLHEIAHDNMVADVCFSPDGKWLASGDHVGKLRIADGESLAILAETQVGAGVQSLSFSADSTLLATGSSNVLLHEVPSGRVLQEISVGRSVCSVSFGA